MVFNGHESQCSIWRRCLWAAQERDAGLANSEPAKPTLSEHQWATLDDLRRRSNAAAILAAAAADVSAPLLLSKSLKVCHLHTILLLAHSLLNLHGILDYGIFNQSCKGT